MVYTGLLLGQSVRSPLPHSVRIARLRLSRLHPACGSVVAGVSRSNAFASLHAAARLNMSCMLSLVSGSRFAMQNSTFTRSIRRASNSATMVWSEGLGLLALSNTSRAHSLIVCAPARDSTCAYSSSVTFVLMDLVRGVGINLFLVPNGGRAVDGGMLRRKINEFPHGNCKFLSRNHGKRRSASCRVCSEFPYSNHRCYTAPVTGCRVNPTP